LVDQEPGDAVAALQDLAGRARAIRAIGVVGEEDDVLVRQRRADVPVDAEAAEPGVENADRRAGRSRRCAHASPRRQFLISDHSSVSHHRPVQSSLLNAKRWTYSAMNVSGPIKPASEMNAMTSSKNSSRRSAMARFRCARKFCIAPSIGVKVKAGC